MRRDEPCRNHQSVLAVRTCVRCMAIFWGAMDKLKRLETAR